MGYVELSHSVAVDLGADPDFDKLQVAHEPRYTAWLRKHLRKYDGGFIHTSLLGRDYHGVWIPRQMRSCAPSKLRGIGGIVSDMVKAHK